MTRSRLSECRPLACTPRFSSVQPRDGDAVKVVADEASAPSERLSGVLISLI
jgi:hypothetical protein